MAGKYFCNVCNQSFEFQQDVERHIEREHSHHDRAPGAVRHDHSHTPAHDGHGHGHGTRVVMREQHHGHHGPPQRPPIDVVHDTSQTSGPRHHDDDAQRRRGVFVCDECGDDFDDEQDIQHHIINHHRIEALETFEEESSSDEEDGGEEEEEDNLGDLLKKLRQAPIPLSRKRHHQDWRKVLAGLDRDKDALEMLQASTKGFWAKVMKMYNDLAEALASFALWKSKLKKVEGTFGSGVYNFFKFMKWAMGLNLLMTLLTVMLIMVPEHYNDDTQPICPVDNYRNMTMFPQDDIDACCTVLYQTNQKWKRDPLDVTIKSAKGFFEDIGTILLNLIQGDG